MNKHTKKRIEEFYLKLRELENDHELYIKSDYMSEWEYGECVYIEAVTDIINSKTNEPLAKISNRGLEMYNFIKKEC